MRKANRSDTAWFVIVWANSTASMSSGPPGVTTGSSVGTGMASVCVWARSVCAHTSRMRGVGWIGSVCTHTSCTGVVVIETSSAPMTAIWSCSLPI